MDKFESAGLHSSRSQKFARLNMVSLEVWELSRVHSIEHACISAFSAAPCSHRLNHPLKHFFFITRAQHALVSSSTMCNPLARSAGVFLLAKIGADTAENEQHFAEILPTDAL